MFEKFILSIKELVQTVLTEKFKAFRSGFMAGSLVSIPFLFHVQNLSHDLIWIFPLKLLMTVTFSFSTGLAAKASTDVYRYFKQLLINRKSKNKTNGRQKSKKDNRAA